MADNAELNYEAQNAEKASSLQVLTFLLDGESYGTDISQIQEVLEFRRVTPVPRTPDYMLGVINLRGQVVPVVDLRRQFDMTISEPTVDTCIVIVDVLVDDEKTALGILADGVKEVIELNRQSITAPPRIGSRIDTRYISGMGEHENDFIIILNLPRVFSTQTLNEVFESVEGAAEPSAPAEDDE